MIENYCGKPLIFSITRDIIFFRVLASRKARDTFPVNELITPSSELGIMYFICSVMLTAPFQS